MGLIAFTIFSDKLKVFAHKGAFVYSEEVGKVSELHTYVVWMTVGNGIVQILILVYETHPDEEHLSYTKDKQLCRYIKYIDSVEWPATIENQSACNGSVAQPHAIIRS